MDEFERLSGGTVDASTSTVRCDRIDGSADGCVSSTCALFKGGSDVCAEVFEATMVGGGRFVTRCGGAEGTIVGGEMGTCVLLEGDGEL